MMVAKLKQRKNIERQTDTDAAFEAATQRLLGAVCHQRPGVEVWLAATDAFPFQVISNILYKL